MGDSDGQNCDFATSHLEIVPKIPPVSLMLRRATMSIEPVQIDTLTERIIGCGMAVHSQPGPGLLESIYHRSMFIELRLGGLRVERKRRLSVKYRGQPVGTLEVDLVVEDLVVVEVKAVERLHPVHSAQVITYLKLTGCPVGLLMNFNAPSLHAGLKRLEHPDRYQKKHLQGKRKSDPPDLLSSCDPMASGRM